MHKTPRKHTENRKNTTKISVMVSITKGNWMMYSKFQAKLRGQQLKFINRIWSMPISFNLTEKNHTYKIYVHFNSNLIKHTEKNNCNQKKISRKKFKYFWVVLKFFWILISDPLEVSFLHTDWFTKSKREITGKKIEIRVK